ncbi:RNA recognition motif domain-containing protein, putative [Eimeria tenella]|uniref:RNA recognition motif domain-containing protein, putative n=1 Tax=Eimeria tenella TaxID=5802 RepID=U6KWL6_EIMTE|nr:RNA recognition motif domain-containing protein, putative [Eimeria tenella]CDJ42512.1 RNA recognition motif domain-containing protein, putative [Eimeria tenella]|eukprot:XP_013233262.1 RNA recognition motif domain-containing protein, putative [Eimeria tenella]
MNAKESRPPVLARQGSLPQSSWRSNRLHPKEDPWNPARQEGDGFSQRKQLLEQLPHAVSSVRIASDNHGGSIYAVVDFTHELLADLALRLLGKTVLLPGTSSKVRLSLHETWSTPLVIDQYHIYVSGLQPGATAAQVEELVTSATGIAPTHVKMSAVAGIPSRRGMQEYAFLRYSDENTSDEVLKKLQVPICLVRQILSFVSPREPLTHAANCSIFIANLPPLTNGEELREICSYFDVVRAAEVHPTRNFGFVRLASHEAALAAITHLQGMQLHGRTLACAWSSRIPAANEEEAINHRWEQEDEAYAIMSAQCMDFEGEETLLPPPQCKESDLHAMSPRQSAKRSAAQASSDAFWLSILAENGPVNISTICSQMKRRQTEVQERLERWNEQEWEEEDLKSNGESSDPPKQ